MSSSKKRTRQTEAQIDCDEAMLQTKKIRWLVPVIPRLQINTERTENEPESAKIGEKKTLVVLECEFCTCVFQSNNELEEHVKIRHSKKKYKCKVCGKEFTKKSYLANHMLIHGGELPFQCTLCPRACRTRTNFLYHMQIHNGAEKPFKCDKCPATFTHQQLMRQHLLSTHSIEKLYECPVKCGRSFTHPQSQRRHAKIHSSKAQKYVCALCKKTFLRKDNLRKHIFSRHAKELSLQSHCSSDKTAPENEKQSAILAPESTAVEKPFKRLQCELCTRVCFSKNELIEHLKIRHCNKKCKCPVCGKSIANKWSLKRHLSRIHADEFPNTCTGGREFDSRQETIELTREPDEIKKEETIECTPEPDVEVNMEKQFEELECEFCNRVCFSNNELEEHMKTRHTNKKYMCNVCEKGFTKKSYLPEHMRIHQDEFPFKCKLCPKVVRTQCNLTSHVIRTHSSKKPFKCDNKGAATFAHKQLMQLHLSTHTNEKPYECPVKCGLRFATAHSQRRHAKIHSNKVQKYECAYCHKKWLRKDALHDHILWRHANESPPESLANDTTVSETEVHSAAGELSTSVPIVPEPEIVYVVESELEELPCEFCTEVCYSKNELREHKETCHGNKKCKCPVCGKGISNKYNLNAHMMRIHDQRLYLYICKTCPRAFQTKNKLVRHNMSIHPDKKSFKCDKSPTTFTLSETLPQHDQSTRRKNEEIKPVKIEKEETIECSFQPYAMELEDTPRYGLEPVEVKKWKTIKCTLEPVGLKEEQETIKCTLEPVAVKEEQQTKQSVEIKPEFKMEEEM